MAERLDAAGVTRRWLEFWSQSPLPGTRWRHAGGAVVVVTGRCLYEPDAEPCVLYRHEADGAGGAVWARPLDVFRKRFSPEAAQEAEQA